MNRNRHPNKAIEATLEYAEANGWRVEIGGGHCWGRLLCPKTRAVAIVYFACANSIWSTPKNPQGHARNIRKWVDGCDGNRE